MIRTRLALSNLIRPLVLQLGLKDEGERTNSRPASKHGFNEEEGLRAMRVLVVDDESVVADSVGEILQEHGYEARVAYSGKQAIDLANAMCPDILVCDVLMPNLNGVQTALAIRQICPNLRILLFSGQAGTVDILKRAQSEGHDFEVMPKPLHPDQLLRRLSS